MAKFRSAFYLSAGSGLAFLAAGVQPVVAQQSGGETQARIEEIIVTARKREETLQDIPLSVSAVSAEAIQRAGLENLEDIAGLTAGLTFQTYNGGGLGSPTIRGLAQTDVASVDNNVGVFLDGVFINNKSNLSLNLLDIERVEVVKGPQSALYGNNAFGGAINYVTRKPTAEPTARFTATTGSDGRYEAGGSVSGTLVENLWTARLSASYSEFDGTIDNTLGDNLGGWDKKTSVVLQSAFTPSERVAARFLYYRGDEEYDASAGYIVVNNCGGSLGSPSGLTGRGQSEQRYFCGELSAPDAVTVSPDAFGNDATTDLVYLDLSVDFGTFELTSLTSWSDSDSAARSDQKLNVPDDIVAPEARRFTSPFFGSTETLSQELRLQSVGSAPLSWTAGAYYIEWESDRAFQVGPASNPAAILNNRDVVESEALAVFGAVEYQFTENWSGAIEGRFTSDSRDAQLLNLNSGADNRFDETFDFFTYRASLNYEFADGTLLYGSVARGAKTGGFNNTPVESEQSFDNEYNTTFEIGYKTTLSQTLTLNSAIYYAAWTDVQLTNPSSEPGNPNVTQNLGDVTSYGLELDVVWKPTDRFQLAAGYAYTDPTYDDGTIDFTHGRRCTTAADCGLPAGPNGGIDVSGQTIDRVSEHQFYASPQYSWSQGDWDFYVRSDITYQSEQYQRSLNLQTVEPRTLVNARAAAFTPGGLEIALWVRNLTDENYFASAINEPEFLFDLANFTLYQSTFTTAFAANTRQFGLSVNYGF